MNPLMPNLPTSSTPATGSSSGSSGSAQEHVKHQEHQEHQETRFSRLYTKVTGALVAGSLSVSAVTQIVQLSQLKSQAAAQMDLLQSQNKSLAFLGAGQEKNTQNTQTGSNIEAEQKKLIKNPQMGFTLQNMQKNSENNTDMRHEIQLIPAHVFWKYTKVEIKPQQTVYIRATGEVDIHEKPLPVASDKNKKSRKKTKKELAKSDTAPNTAPNTTSSLVFPAQKAGILLAWLSNEEPINTQANTQANTQVNTQAKTQNEITPIEGDTKITNDSEKVKYLYLTVNDDPQYYADNQGGYIVDLFVSAAEAPKNQ